jgi:hypothetical protein
MSDSKLMSCTALGFGVLLFTPTIWTGYNEARGCHPAFELCPIENAVLSDEALEHLPRGPAPAQQEIVVTATLTTASLSFDLFSPRRYIV